MQDKKCQVKFSLLACLLGIMVFACIWAYKQVKPTDTIYRTTQTIRYSFEVSNRSNRYIASPAFSTFAPVAQNSYQKTVSVDANFPFKLKIDQSGNQVLLFELPGLAPFSSQVINITAVVKLADNPQAFALEDSRYLGSEPGVETTASEIASLATKLDGDPEKISRWLYRNIKNIGYVAEDRGASYAITARQGDCTEFASAFVALSRSSNIPARMIGGFTINSSGRLFAENYHNWAEYKAKDQWEISDPQNNILGDGYGSYIAFYNFDKYSRLENSHRFLTYDKRLIVQMK
ncbi:transglutaminase-like domain-containing protein [Microbulbifer sp. A4B17]|uniref:transglutaminase-like domain-containing protein n=1 Tax=Microbulbifer sp. A4B17 TaxID=359370 RepID=UPI0013007DE1|nr:transglutaminase-like domain-containing protein [Microbulbifer sp. A4B17]